MDGTPTVDKELDQLFTRLRQLAQNKVAREVDYGVSLTLFNSLIRSEMYNLLQTYITHRFNPSTDAMTQQSVGRVKD